MIPDRPPVFEPYDARFWEERDLERELYRVFAVCEGCRMCAPYCGSFPFLFEKADQHEHVEDGSVANSMQKVVRLRREDIERVVDLCWQCKQCYFKCPYTADDGHEWLIDFPRLMMREKAVRARRSGIALTDRVLGEPQLLGRLAAGPLAGMNNVVLANRLVRKVQAKTFGISEEFPLPPFASQSLFGWFRDHPGPSEGANGSVVMFATCTTTWNVPAPGIAAVKVLRHNGFGVALPSTQTCCGMPNLDGGDIESAMAKAKRNVDVLLPFVDAGATVVVMQPTCGYTLKKEYPSLLGTPEAQRVADATQDLMEFLLKKARKKLLSRETARGAGKVAYHAPCHLRAQRVGTPSRQLLEMLLPETKVTVVEQCSAVDGTWGMKQEFYEMGRSYARKLVDGMSDGDPDVLATDCPLSGLRLTKELGRETVHPIELIARGYGL
ncbi:MAG: 4Fe-4S dicluster domain-containing protein [Deltaproteobacteria bacterium]|nr:4Fe-4S dicluster domain-containing protein [Deltaproteobacteria bacterium]